MSFSDEITDKKLEELVEKTINAIREGAKATGQEPHAYLELFVWYYLVKLIDDSIFNYQDAIGLLENDKFKVLHFMNYGSSEERA